MKFTSVRPLDDHVLEHRFTMGAAPGILWTPSAGQTPAPLILVGHPGGLARLEPRLTARAKHYATHYGFAAASIELPGSGDRPQLASLEQARSDLRTAMANGDPIDTIVDQLVIPLVEKAVPELRSLLDALLALPALDGPVGYEGGFIAIGIRLAAVDARVAAANLFAGSVVPKSIVEEARDLSIPLQVLLQWDDEGNDRAAALELFDAFGSREKTLHANMGGHTGVPAFEIDAGAQFFARHLWGPTVNPEPAE